MEAASPQLQAVGAGRKLGALYVGAMLLGLVVLAGLTYLAYDRILARPIAQPIGGMPTAVQRGDVAAVVSATGAVVSTRQARLSMQLSGRLEELPVKLGDRVKAGAVLARVDTAPLELKLAQARSTLRTSQLKLEQVRSGPRAEDVAGAEAAVQSAQARLSDLTAGSLPQEIAQAQSQADNAAAAVRQAQARLDAVRAGSTGAEVAAAEQAVQAAQSNLKKAEVALDVVRSGVRPEDVRAQELAVEQARNALWARQLSRDAVCGRGAGTPCDSARADVAAAESAVTQAQVRLEALKLPVDPRSLELRQADIDVARESLRSAQIRLEQVKAGPTSQDVRHAQAALEAAQATHQAALARVEGLRRGAKPGEVQAALAAVTQAEQTLALKRAPITAQEIALAEEQVRQSELAVQQVQLDIENATLTAPFDGVVGLVSANVGEQVGSTSPIVTLIDPRATRVDVNVDEVDVARIAPGKPVQITFDATPDRRFTGTVLGIAPSATLQPGITTYTVSASIDDAGDLVLPPGLTARVGVVVAEKQNVLLVPNRAIKRQSRGPVVDVLVGGRTESRPITTGLANDQVTEVVAGLTEGEQVLMPATVTMPTAAAPAAAKP